MAALTVAVICIAVARIVTKLKHKWDKLYEPLILIPWLLPSTMIALGLMMTYDEARWNLANKVLVATPVIMLIAYMIIKLPFSYRMIRAAFIGLDGNMEEAAQANRVVVMDDGKVVLDNTPKEVFSHVETLKKIGLDVPQVTELAYRLQQAGCPVDVHMISEEECVASLTKLLSGKTGGAAWQS